MTKSILLVGVGGQGTILASKLLTSGLLEAGYDVRMSEIVGMSQRGGSVSSHVRYGEEVSCPSIEKGSADMIVAFEKMEALRWLEYLKPDGKVVVNDFEIGPMPVLQGKAKYAKDILEQITSKADTTVIEAAKEASALGNSKVMNIILLGTIVKNMKLQDINWDAIIEKGVKPKFVDINKKALKVGMDLI